MTQECLFEGVRIQNSHHYSHSDAQIQFPLHQITLSSTCKTFRTEKNYLCPVERDPSLTCAVLRFISIGMFGCIQCSVLEWFITLQNLLIARCLCIGRRMEGSCEFEACATLSKEKNKTDIVFYLTFIFRSQRTQSMRKFNFFHHFGKPGLNDWRVSFDCSYVFESWDAACKFERKGIFLSIIRNVAHFGYYFWSLIKFKTLK
jgi:hypothetical protein